MKARVLELIGAASPDGCSPEPVRIQCGPRIVPVELKAGAAGAMKSLHQFMFDKGLTLAVRLDRNPPSLQAMDLATTKGQAVRYRLLNLPHYLAWRIGELVEQS